MIHGEDAHKNRENRASVNSAQDLLDPNVVRKDSDGEMFSPVEGSK